MALLLFITNNQLANQKTQLSQLRTQQFHDQLNEGKACGLLTNKEASTLLQSDVVLESGSIVPSSSPTAATRAGSPRIDGCTYVSQTSNGTYADVVLKSYDSNAIASDSFKKDTSKMLFIADRPVPEGSTITAIRYSSGVHYVLLNNTVIEVSASKLGASVGDPLEQFSNQVTQFVVAKL